MIMVAKFDELNILSQQSEKVKRQVSIPYDEYFGIMNIPEKEIKKRIALANELEDAFLLYFDLYSQALSIGMSTVYAKEQLRETVVNSLSDVMVLEDSTFKIVDDIVDDVEKKTKKYSQEDEWYLSDDRAIALAENGSNSFYNNDDYEIAIKQGKTQKTWVTEKDNKVRNTHKEVDEVTIPINEVFHVGNSEMMFAGDGSLGASDSELINCRCVTKYK